MMPGRATAVSNAAQLTKAVCELAAKLGLDARQQFRLARRIWGAERSIDVVLRHGPTGKTLGVECKYQDVRGTAEEKIPTTIKDIEAWPIPGIVVFSGAGFTENMKGYLISTGKAVGLEDLEPWLRLYFGLPLEG